jgi:hypothetical protein
MRAVACLLPVLALGIGACGGMSDSERFSLKTPGVDDTIVRTVPGSEKPRVGKPTKDEMKVIRAWSEAQRRGRVEEAAALFAVPATVADGVHLEHSLDDRDAILDFVRSLTCGGKLVEARRGFTSTVIATFRITELPGGSTCRKVVGKRIDTTFVVERGLIQQWKRAIDPVMLGG